MDAALALETIDKVISETRRISKRTVAIRYGFKFRSQTLIDIDLNIVQLKKGLKKTSVWLSNVVDIPDAGIEKIFEDLVGNLNKLMAQIKSLSDQLKRLKTAVNKPESNSTFQQIKFSLRNEDSMKASLDNIMACGKVINYAVSYLKETLGERNIQASDKTSNPRASKLSGHRSLKGEICRLGDNGSVHAVSSVSAYEADGSGAYAFDGAEMSLSDIGESFYATDNSEVEIDGTDSNIGGSAYEHLRRASAQHDQRDSTAPPSYAPTTSCDSDWVFQQR
ncbi:hypothetical protein EDC01DRAFT_666930 [Geopyxis carbonaria]|nr:hypothetical protein EDC01DRAFT_666930 [Geopyxis carbonaria]